jgi:hypothetical protein
MRALLVSTVIFAANPILAAEIYVDAAATAAGADGTLTKPYTVLQTAIDAAQAADEIRVAAGNYAPISVNNKELRLLGGYAPGFAARAPAVNLSIIQGTAAASTVELYETASSVLDGFVIRGGLHGVSIDADYLSTTNRPVVRGNVIEQNGIATQEGGGIAAAHCDASIVANVIRDNIASKGPAVASGCASLRVTGNTIEDNVAYSDHSGGLYLSGADLLVQDNLIRGNEVGVIAGYGWGGGAVVYNVGTNVVFRNNVWTDNIADSIGSAVFIDDGAVALFDHELFYANRCAGTGGAAVYIDGYDMTGSQVRLENVTIAEHNCPAQPGVAVYVERYSTAVLHNSIIWGNGGDDFDVDATSTISGTYTLSEEALAGTGNLSADPLFFNAAAGDFHVRSTKGRYDVTSGTFVMDAVDSPTIDAGDPATSVGDEPGPNGLRINLGHTGGAAQASMGAPGGVPPATGPTGTTGTTGASGATGASGMSGPATPGAPGASDDPAPGGSAAEQEHGASSQQRRGCHAAGDAHWLGLMLIISLLRVRGPLSRNRSLAHSAAPARVNCRRGVFRG